MNAYDFDETIYDGESSVEFILQYMKQNPKTISFLPSVVKIMHKYRRGEMSFEDFTKTYAARLSSFIKENDVDVTCMVGEFWNKRIGKIKPFYRELQREDDVIITASPEFMMRDICSRIGVRHLVSTKLNLETGVIEQACFRQGKIECFRQAFPNGVIDDFYTDSINDCFLFPFAKRVFMVKGNKIKRIK